MNKVKIVSITLFLMFFLAANLASAQEFGSIKGEVKDADGLPLPGVTVTLTGNKIASMTSITSQGGVFRFVSLPVANDYALKFELGGFNTLTREEITVTFNRDVELDIIMEPSTITEEVTVVGQAPVIDSKRAQVGENITQEMIMQLPTARNPWVLMSVIPGVLVDREDVGGNEAGQQSEYYGHGSSADDNTWNVDGANITDNSALGAAPAYLNVASYEEIQVNYGNNDVKSQTGGVQINLVSRRGGNDYSGTFYMDASRNAWQADNVPEALKDKGYTAAGINRLYLYGANFGGPIMRDRAWFYLAWGIQDIDALALTGDSDKTWLASGYGRLDFQITPSTRANFFLEYDNKQKWNRPILDYTLQDADTLWNQKGPGYLYKGEIDQMIGNLYLNAKAIYTNQGFNLAPVKAHTEDGSGTPTTWIAYPSLYLQGNIFDYGTDRNQLNVNVSGIYFAEDVLGSDHEFKFGVDYVSSTTSSFSLYEGNIALNYYGPDEGVPNGEWWEINCMRDYRPNYLFTRYSAYLQDTASFGRVALNLGLRYDYEKSIVKDINVPAARFMSDYLPAVQLDEYDPGINWSVFSPRLSLTYDITGDGKTVVKLAAARYGSQSGNNIADHINPIGFAQIDLLWQDLNQDSVVTENELFGYDWDTGTLQDRNNPDYWLWYSSAVNPDNPTEVKAQNSFADNYNSPYLDELSASIEREIFTDFAGRVEFFYKKRHRSNWYRSMNADGELETEDNYYAAGIDETTGSTIYGRYDLYAFEYLQNHDKAYDRYLGFQVVFNKRLSGRWMMNGSFTWSDWKRYYEGEYLGIIKDVISSWPYQLQEGPNNQEYFSGGVVAPESSGSGVSGIFVNSVWQAKLSGLYQLPWDINFSGVFTLRDGYVIPTHVNVNMPGIGYSNLYGDPNGSGTGKLGDHRLPVMWVLNLRAEKTFRVSDTSTVTLAADAFNLTNSAHSLKREPRITADDYMEDLRILNPRVFRFGVRFNF